ncbi:MAG: aminopeptidase N C-terminal domain-containing protein [Desulfobacterales bacterium]
MKKFIRRIRSAIHAVDPAFQGRRSLKNLVLTYLGRLETEEIIDLICRQFQQAGNMTDELLFTVLSDTIRRAQKRQQSVFMKNGNPTPFEAGQMVFASGRLRCLRGFGKCEGFDTASRFSIRNPNKV